MRVAVLADIGHPAEHVGDDAIAVATYNELISRGITPVMLTHNAKDSQRLFPQAKFFTAPIFSRNPAEQVRQYREATANPRNGLRLLTDQLFSDVDGVVIAGGGSLNSYYSWLAFERIFLATQGHQAGKPVVLTGNSFGPLIIDEHKDAIRDLASSVNLAGFRGPLSAELARQHGFADPLTTCDDTAGMAAIRIDDVDQSSSFIVGSFATPLIPELQPLAVSTYAAVLDFFSRKLSLPIRLAPHMANHQVKDQDLAFHEEIAEQCAEFCEVLPLSSPEETIRGLAGAHLTVTSRFHQAVFSYMQGIPVLPINTDCYGSHRMRDLLSNHGIAQDWSLSLSSLQGANRNVLLQAFLDNADNQRRHLLDARPHILEHHTRWWDGIASGFKTGHFKVDSLAGLEALAAPEIFKEANTTARPYLSVIDEKIASDLRIAQLTDALSQSLALNEETAKQHEQEKRAIVNAYESRKAIRIADGIGGRVRRMRRLLP